MHFGSVVGGPEACKQDYYVRAVTNDGFGQGLGNRVAAVMAII